MKIDADADERAILLCTHVWGTGRRGARPRSGLKPMHAGNDSYSGRGEHRGNAAIPYSAADAARCRAQLVADGWLDAREELHRGEEDRRAGEAVGSVEGREE